MKHSVLFLGLSIVMMTSVAFAGQTKFPHIICEDSHKDRMELVPDTIESKNASHGKLQVYNLHLDEALSSSYVGAFGEQGGYQMLLSLNLKESKKHQKDVLDDWDGNVGATVVMPKGTVLGRITAGKKFPAKVTIVYDDISQDEVTNKLVCVIVK